MQYYFHYQILISLQNDTKWQEKVQIFRKKDRESLINNELLDCFNVYSNVMREFFNGYELIGLLVQVLPDCMEQSPGIFLTSSGYSLYIFWIDTYSFGYFHTLSMLYPYTIQGVSIQCLIAKLGFSSGYNLSFYGQLCTFLSTRTSTW